MNKKFFYLLVATLCCVVGTQSVMAQSTWVDFNDERSRMMFDTNDDEEKDVAVCDVDNDGDSDIVVARKFPFSVAGPRNNLLLLNEGGNLVDRTDDYAADFNDPTDDRDIAFFDFNNDGWMDIVTVTTFGQNPRLYENLGNDGKGQWLGYANRPNWFSPAFPVGPKFCGVGIGDVNMDGFDDLYFVDYDNNLENRLLMNDGDGTFTDESLTRLSFDARQVGFGTAAFITDFNYDGFPDIVSLESTVEGGGNGEGLGIEFCINDGTGNFNDVQVLPSNLTYMHELADFNGDGRDDLYVVSDVQDYIIYNLSSNPNGTVNVDDVLVVQSQLTAGFSGNVHAADVDQDGMMDLAACDIDVDIPGCSRRFALLRNNGTTLFDPNNSINPLAWNEQGSHDMCWIDVNQDGYLDMFIATCTDYHMYVNDAPLIVGDLNLDGEVNLLDVQPFIDILANSGFQLQADTNNDGVV
ncbi:MAG: VCBS repeat-containing protein, partial [Planctomycetota bacterium]